MLAQFVRRFHADARITRRLPAGGLAEWVDARSTLSLIGLDAHEGDEFIVAASGADAVELVRACAAFATGDLVAAEERFVAAAVSERPRPSAAELPLVLRRHDPRHVFGRGVSPGIGAGIVVAVAACELNEQAKSARSTGVEDELAAARHAGAAVIRDLSQREQVATTSLERDLLRAHREISDDPALWRRVEQLIRGGATALQATAAAAHEFAASLLACTTAYARDRVLDVQDVAGQLIGALGGSAALAFPCLGANSIVVARALTPSQLLRLDRNYLRGLVLSDVGETSHTMLLARSLGIPTIVDVDTSAAVAFANRECFVDGDAGLLIAADAVTSRYYENEIRIQSRRRAALAPLSREPATTSDGGRFEIGVNAASIADVEVAVANGADGIGLFRTEFLFMGRDAPPTEDEQAAVCAAAVDAARGRPIIFRTFDIGGDKPAPYLDLAREANPYLGRRGFRLYDLHADVLQTQLRAILRASARGPVKIMAPFVTHAAEAGAFRSQVEAARAAVVKRGDAVADRVPIGVMVEIPSLVLQMSELAHFVDFVSIGTNDLSQYWFAADRGNPAVAAHCDLYSPSFLRLLRLVVSGAKTGNLCVGVCGELGSDLNALPILLGLGVDEISVRSAAVAETKRRVRAASRAMCQSGLDAALAAADSTEVRQAIEPAKWGISEHAPVVSGELIATGVDAQDKGEAIKAAVDLLFVAGRTDDRRAIESAVWAREETYSTGLGYGFSLPHCKTDAIGCASLVVLKLATPVDWQSLDGAPVRTVMLLAAPAGDSAASHLRVFAALARKLMHEDFRRRIDEAADPAGIERILTAELPVAGV